MIKCPTKEKALASSRRALEWAVRLCSAFVLSIGLYSPSMAQQSDAASNAAAQPDAQIDEVDVTSRRGSHQPL